MLTLFLLVVLGGGAGLLAVSLVDSRGLSRLVGRFERSSLRAHRRRHTATGPAAAPSPPPSVPVDAADQPVLVEAEVLETSPAGDVVAVVAPVLAPANGAADHPPTGVLEAAGPPRARAADRRSVPAAYTAVEGTYRDVARAGPARRLASFASLLALVVVLGVAVAALAGAAIGTAAELLDRTIG